MPGPMALQQECCQPSCDEVSQIQVPGPAGNDGDAGADGVPGESAYTTLAAQFLMPAEGATVNAVVGSTAWMVVGQPLAVQVAGTMIVSSITNAITVVLQNPENTASSLYAANAAPTTAIPAGSKISPSGVQGPAGTLTGAAGGDLKGTYPNPDLLIPNAKGRIIVGNGTDAVELSAGTDGHVIRYNSATATGLETGAVNMAGGANHVTGVLPVANGGTNGATANAGFNNLSPVTTQGDIIYRDATVNTRLGIGAANTVLRSTGTAPAWTKITGNHIDPTYHLGERQTVIIPGQVVNLNGVAGTDTPVILAGAMTRYIIRRIIIENASTNLAVSAARIGVYTNTLTGGIAIVTAPNSELTSLTTSAIYEDLTLAAGVAFTVFTVPALYIYLSAAHGSAATITLWAFGDDLAV